MHSTTNNPNLRKNFVGNLLKKIIFMTPYWKQTVPMSGMSYTSTPPPQTITTTPQYLHTVAMWCITK